MNDLIDRLKRGIDSSGGVNAQIYFYQALCDEAAQHIKDQADKIQGLVDAVEKVMDWEFPKHLDAGYDGFLEDWQELQIAITAYKEGK